MIIKTFLSVFTLGGENGNCPVFALWVLEGVGRIKFYWILLEYTMTRQLGSSVLSIYKWSGEGYRKWTEITANCSNVNNMTHSVCWWWLCGRRVCVILGTGVHRRRRLPPLVTVIWCLYIPHCLVTAQRPQITCVYAGITWNDLYND